MKTETHHQSGHQQPEVGGKQAGDCDPKTQQQYRRGGKTVFPDQHDHVNGQKGQKTGNLPDRLNHSDMLTVEAGGLDGKIVEQSPPGLQPHG